MKWSESDVDDLRKFYARGMTDSAMAKMLDRSEPAVGMKRQKLGLTHRRNLAAKLTGAKVWTAERMQELAGLHEDRWTDQEIATHFGNGMTPRAVAVQRGKQGAVAYRCRPKASIGDYQTGTIISELRSRGFDVIVRTS